MDREKFIKIINQLERQKTAYLGGYNNNNRNDSKIKSQLMKEQDQGERYKDSDRI